MYLLNVRCVKIHCMDCNIFYGMHVEGVKGINKYTYLLKEWWNKMFHGEVLEAKTCTTMTGPPASWTKKGEEVAPRNPSTQRNPSLPEDDQIMYSKIGLHLVKIHVLINFLVWCLRCQKYHVWNIVESIVCMSEVSKGIHVHILYTALLFQAH